MRHLILTTKYELFVLSATCSDLSISRAELAFHLPDLDMVPSERANRRGYGEFAATCRSLLYRIIEISSRLKALFVSRQALYPEAIIGVCCRSPYAEQSFVREYHDVSDSISGSHPNIPMILLVDFNFR